MDERTFGVAELGSTITRIVHQAFPGRCWVRGQRHAGGNNVWYFTNGDLDRAYGYVPASKVRTDRDPFPGLARCGPTPTRTKSPSPTGTPPTPSRTPALRSTSTPTGARFR